MYKISNKYRKLIRPLIKMFKKQKILPLPHEKLRKNIYNWKNKCLISQTKYHFCLNQLYLCTKDNLYACKHSKCENTYILDQKKVGRDGFLWGGARQAYLAHGLFPFKINVCSVFLPNFCEVQLTKAHVNFNLERKY